MEHFNVWAAPTIFAMVATWWIAVYLFSRNPYSEKIRAFALGTILISSYTILSVLQSNLKTSDAAYVGVQKILIWAITFPAPVWFYFSTTMLPKERREKLKPLVILGFASGLVISFLGMFTNLLYNYSSINAIEEESLYLVHGGKLFFLESTQVIVFTFLAVYNFYKFASETKKEVREAFKLLTLGSAFIALSGTFLTLNVMFGNLFNESPGEIGLLIGLGVITYSIMRYSSVLETGANLFGREFILSTGAVLILYAIFGATLFLIGFPYSFKLLLLIVSGLLLLPITHTGYDWFTSFARNIFYQKTLELPKVTDGEVGLLLRNYNRPSHLEESSLLRLKVLRKLAESEAGDKIAALRKLVREAIDYLKPDNSESRNRPNLKYQMLKLISEQVEEGQILWDLGFEEYPLAIAEKGEGRNPDFPVEKPTDYQATSRNAFISLKKEAIHDLAWRISYLEKNSK